MRRLITNITFITFVLAAGWAVLPSSLAYAQGNGTGNGNNAAGNSCGTPNLLFPQWYDGLCENGRIKSPNDINKSANTADDTGRNIGTWVLVIVMNVVKTLLTVVGYVSLGFVMWGGFKYMTQGDNASGTAGARKTIQNAIIGLVLSMMSVAMINFITNAIV
jgi:hypothetical protein